MTQQALRELVELAERMCAADDWSATEEYELLPQAVVSAIPHLKALLGEQREAQGAIDMLLYCPKCGRQHIDAAGPDPEWTNPPHRSHKCRFSDCGHVWRPADVATNGVLALDTIGQNDGSPNPKDFAPPLADSVGDGLTDIESNHCHCEIGKEGACPTHKVISDVRDYLRRHMQQGK